MIILSDALRERIAGALVRSSRFVDADGLDEVAHALGALRSAPTMPPMEGVASIIEETFQAAARSKDPTGLRERSRMAALRLFRIIDIPAIPRKTPEEVAAELSRQFSDWFIQGKPL